MKIKNLASKVGIDKIITKKDRTSLYLDNEKTKPKTEQYITTTKKLNENEKTDIKKKTINFQLFQILISVKKTLLFLKKTENKTITFEFGC